MCSGRVRAQTREPAVAPHTLDPSHEPQRIPPPGTSLQSSRVVCLLAVWPSSAHVGAPACPLLPMKAVFRSLAPSARAPLCAVECHGEQRLLVNLAKGCARARPRSQTSRAGASPRRLSSGMLARWIARLWDGAECALAGSPAPQRLGHESWAPLNYHPSCRSLTSQGPQATRQVSGCCVRIAQCSPRMRPATRSRVVEPCSVETWSPRFARCPGRPPGPPARGAGLTRRAPDRPGPSPQAAPRAPAVLQGALGPGAHSTARAAANGRLERGLEQVEPSQRGWCSTDPG